MRYILILPMLFILSGCIGSGPRAGHPKKITGTVVKVSDGDTITIEAADDKYKIRLFGIDTPEKKQEFGMVSKQALSDMVLNEKVTIKVSTVDRYGRIVGIVFKDDLEVNLEMLRLGMAWCYRRYIKKRDLRFALYVDAEETAKKENKGLWGTKDPVPPWKWRKDKKKNNSSFMMPAYLIRTA